MQSYSIFICNVKEKQIKRGYNSFRFLLHAGIITQDIVKINL